VSQGVAPILWQNGSQITRLNIPLNPSFLVYDGTITRWGDGSAQAPVYLPNIQEVNGPTVTYVAGITSTGQLVKTIGASGTALIGGVAGAVVYQSAPSTTGFTAAGTTGQLLSSNGASVPTWLNQSAIAAGSATSATSATNIASGGAGQIPYNTGSGATSFVSAGTSGQILQSNGTSAPSWSSNISVSQLTFADSSIQNTAATGFGFKNRFINGAFAIDQRNNGASQTVSGFAYTLDRWYITANGSTVTSQRVGSAGAYSWQITGNTGNTSNFLVQRIESVNIGDLAGQTVTISFTASSSTLTSILVTAQTPTAVDNYTTVNTGVAVGTASITSTPTRFSYTFTMPSSATNGVQIYFQTGAFTSGTLTLSNVQLEKGATATEFDVRPYGTELQLCQRYYWSFTTGFIVGGGYALAGNVFPWSYKLPQSMRASPTLVNGTPNYANATLKSVFTNPDFIYYSFAVTNTGAFSFSFSTSGNVSAEI